jgi:hypothetical protein
VKTAVAETSINAYFAMLAGDKVTDGQKKVLAAFARHIGRDFTRAELEHVTGLRTGTVCGRCNELIAKGAIVDNGRRKCTVTGQNAYALRLASRQGDLFGVAA